MQCSFNTHKEERKGHLLLIFSVMRIVTNSFHHFGSFEPILVPSPHIERFALAQFKLDPLILLGNSEHFQLLIFVPRAILKKKKAQLSRLISLKPYCSDTVITKLNWPFLFIEIPVVDSSRCAHNMWYILSKPIVFSLNLQHPQRFSLNSTKCD